MQIIDNVNGSHYKSILNMLSEANGMTVASPFLMEDFHEFIYDVACLGVKNISLITTLKDNNPDLLIKASSLYSFVLACKKNDVSYEIRTNNRLHGKLYIALNGNNPLKGIVTSANLTSNGLSYSHEWGVEFDDESKLQGIIEDLYKYSSSPISNENLDHIIRTIDEYQTSNPPVPQEKPKIVVS